MHCFFTPCQVLTPFFGGWFGITDKSSSVWNITHPSALGHQGTGDTYARHMKAAPGARYRTQGSGRLGGTRSQHTPTGLSGPQGRGPSTRDFFLLLFLLDSIGASRGKVRLGGFGEAFLPGTTVHLHRMEDRASASRPSCTHVPTYLHGCGPRGTVICGIWGNARIPRTESGRHDYGRQAGRSRLPLTLSPPVSEDGLLRAVERQGGRRGAGSEAQLRSESGIHVGVRIAECPSQE